MAEAREHRLDIIIGCFAGVLVGPFFGVLLFMLFAALGPVTADEGLLFLLVAKGLLVLMSFGFISGIIATGICLANGRRRAFWTLSWILIANFCLAAWLQARL